MCATPIGNLSDVTERLKQTLQSVAVVAAEDTRHTQKLLNHLDIRGVRVLSYHQHNERHREDELIDILLGGEDVALVSDAGTPGISDPGALLIARAVERGLPIAPIPGPSAVIASLSASGLPLERFVFMGFLARSQKQRTLELADLAKRQETVVLYEAPHRLAKTLSQLCEVCGRERQAVLARELTKLHEEFLRGNLGELCDFYKKTEARGEFVILIQGYSGRDEQQAQWWESVDIADHVERLMDEEGLTEKEAMKAVAVVRGIAKRDVYGSVVKRKESE